MNLAAIADKKIESNNKLPDPGAYMGYIEKVSKKTSAAGNNYLSMQVKLTNAEGKGCGCVFPMLFDSDNEFLQGQAAALLNALGIPMEGEMDLDQLSELICKQEVTTIIRIEEGKEGYKDKAVVDYYTYSGFQPIADFDKYDCIINKGEAWNDDDSFMNLPDGLEEEVSFC